MNKKSLKNHTYFATIDLGSNSFHLTISYKLPDGTLHTAQKHKAQVQLRSGLCANDTLSIQIQERALQCFRNFKIIMDQYPIENTLIVGTYTLRKAQKNIRDFLKKSERILGTPIQVISGEEEAKLIFLGATYKSPSQDTSLFIDIGGGSTEMIIGMQRTIKHLVSLEFGCVSIQTNFFADNKLNHHNFSAASQHICDLLKDHINTFKNENSNWNICLGSSGSIQALHSMLNDTVTFEKLQQLKSQLIQYQTIDQLMHSNHFSLREDRYSIIAGGFAILYNLFEQLNIREIHPSKGALREGLIYRLFDKINCEKLLQQDDIQNQF